MVMKWCPDTCDCAIEYDDVSGYVATVQVCKEPTHVAVAGTAEHLEVVLEHHRPFNDLSRYTSELPEGEEREQDLLAQAAAARAAERERIRGLEG
jgi:hypothetical protein